MTTIKLPIQNEIDILMYLKQYNNVVRFAYNRLQEGKSLSQVERQVKDQMNNIELMDASLIKAAADAAKGITNKKVIFGGKSNWKRYNRGLITKEQYRQNKLRPLTVRGSKTDHNGNRKFTLDIANNQLFFKPNRKTKIVVQLPKTKHDSTLLKLQQLCEEGSQHFTCGLTLTHVHITFDETILRSTEYHPIKKRLLAVDLNPNYVGFVIRDKDTILHKEVIGLTDLNEQQTTKKKHEDFEICKRIIQIAKHYRVSHLVHEKLDMKSSDKQKGKKYNKLVNNNWRRSRTVKNLTKWCNIIGIQVQPVIAQYSTFIGQINNPNEYDSIAASLELARRGMLFIRKYYYNENIEIKGKIIGIKDKLNNDLVDRWKKILNYDGVLSTYKCLYDQIKKAKYSYRFFFQHKWFSSRMKSPKSRVMTFSCFV